MEGTINGSVLQLMQFMTVLLTGLISGLFYGYDCSVIKGLGNLQNEAYLQSFQSINNVIQNPWFFASFMGCLLVLPVASWWSYSNSGPVSFYLLLLASIIYVIGVFGVTMLGNVPLNDRLAAFSISGATENEISLVRKGFEVKWNTYHRIRTIASLLSFGLTILALLKQKT